MSFSGKVAIVTGASSGIGAAIAVQFAEQGASVVLVGRNVAKLEATAATCSTQGPRPLIVVADVGKDQDANRIIDETIKQFGKLDILVNNAGIGDMEEDKIQLETFMSLFDRVILTNLRAVVYLTHLAIPHLIKNKGNIVNISSIAGVKAFQNTSYCTSKAGLDHFTRCIALELAPKGVRVNVVNPGPVVTDFMLNSGMDQAASDAMWEKLVTITALGRVSQSVEVADVVLFLAGDKARGVTGSTYLTDNGACLK